MESDMRAVFRRFMLFLLIVGASAAGGWWPGSRLSFGQTSLTIEIEDFWAPPVSDTHTTALVYGVLRNTTGHDDALIAVLTPIAKHTAIKLHVGKNERLHVEKNEERAVGSIGLPKGKYVKLRPSEFYIVLGELREELKTGQSFPMTLQFQSTGQVKVTVRVSTNPPPPPQFIYAGGDGSSDDTYVIIHGARDYEEVNTATLAWLAKNYPDWKVVSEGIAISPDRKLLRVIGLCRGECQKPQPFGIIVGDRQVYFDLGDVDFAIIDPNDVK
jgi:periplasmic copper chaperone A